ncbi:hypothetical protein P154DRAFT_424384, partial [Amniculicola lignicola CBS 123094]
VQNYFFYFLFIQVIIILSLLAGITSIVNKVKNRGFLATTLVKNLLKASNYFFSYILL